VWSTSLAKDPSKQKKKKGEGGERGGGRLSYLESVIRETEIVSSTGVRFGFTGRSEVT